MSQPGKLPRWLALSLASALVVPSIPTGSSWAQDEEEDEDYDEEGDYDEDDEGDEGGEDESMDEPGPSSGAGRGEAGEEDDAQLMGDDESFDEDLEDDTADETDVDDEAKAVEVISDLLDIYLTKQIRRDPLERIVVDGGRAEIWFLHGMKGGERQRDKCNAMRWLLFGRLHRSKGIRKVFEKLPALQEIRLTFFTIETTVQPDHRRGYRQFRKADPKLELTISRETAMGLDLHRLREEMKGERCLSVGERVMDKKWYWDEKEDK